MKLFDLHCDTPRRIYDEGLSLKSSHAHICLEKAKIYSPYIQIAAVWCTFDSTEKAYGVFNETVARFDKECKINNCDIIKNANDLLSSVKAQDEGRSNAGFIYSIEDCGFITSADILDDVYDKGVRILIPMWGETNALGASHEANGGLTPLGKEVLTRAAQKGMILDISHASITSADDIMDIAEKYSSPIIASHSNSRVFFDHTRNLYTEQAKRLVSLGGIIGHSLCTWHLAESGKADINTVLDNISRLVEDVGEDNVAFGCDLDGTDLPLGFNDITSLSQLYDHLSIGFSPSTADKIFYQNALNKFQQFLK